MESNNPVVIVSMARTPQGSFQGCFASMTASELGAVAIKETVKRAGIPVEEIDEVVMGCVLSAGQGQAPARQASIGAGLTLATSATTINKMCGSGMRAVMFAHDMLRAGSCDVMIAGGMESMTNAPYLLGKARAGYRMGHGEVIDHMFFDGLEDAYDKGKLMGVFADDTAKKLGLTRKEQDEFAIRSLNNAGTATSNGEFKQEITPVIVKTRKGEIEVTEDEALAKAMPEKIPNLKPAFTPDGTVTAANASSISDGASAICLMLEDEANKRGLKILAEIKGHASHAQKPSEFTLAPVGATRKLLDKVKWNSKDVDLFEINEAFAVVSLAAIRGLDLDIDKVNVNGGACALGHPIGSSGSRILITLYHALKNRGLSKGVASLCIGGGEATAMAIELRE